MKALKEAIQSGLEKEDVIRAWKRSRTDTMVKRALEEGRIVIDAEEVRKEFFLAFIGSAEPLIYYFASALGFTAKLICESHTREINKRYGDRVRARCESRGRIKKKWFIVVESYGSPAVANA